MHNKSLSSTGGQSRWRRAIRAIGARLLVVLWLLFASGSAGLGAITGAIRPASAQTGVPGVTNLDIVLVIDESGSMWERNDPQIFNADGTVKNPGWRIVAANLLAQWLATDQSGAQHQLSVIMFGTDAKVIFPLQEIHSQESQAAYQKALNDNHAYLGATDIVEAMRLARTELDKARAGDDVKRAVIFLSDGVCEPRPVTSPAERRQCERDLREVVQRDFAEAQLPVFTIALTSDAFKKDPANTVYKNVWQEIAATTGGDYYEPVQAERELLEAFVGILQRLFGLPIQAPPPPVDAPTELTFEVAPDLLQIGFTTIKYEPGIEMTVIRPDGTVVEVGDPGVQYSSSALTESYSISRPPPGTWTVRLSGRGKVILVTVPFSKNKFLIERQRPAATHPQGKPMDISVRVLDVDQIARTAQQLTVEITLPDGATTSATLTPSGQSYVARLDNTAQAGMYTLRFAGSVVNADGSAFDLSDQQSVQVAAVPWLQIVAPQAGRDYPNNLPVPVQAQVMLGAQPLTQLNPDDQFEVIARLRQENGQAIDTQFLRPAPGGVFSGTVAAGADGNYALRVELEYRPASGETFKDATEAPVSISGVFVPITPTPIPPPPAPPAPPSPLLIGGIAGILLLAGVVAMLVLWQRSKPDLVGSVEVAGAPYALRGKRPVTIGADPRNRISIQGAGVLPRHAELRPMGSPQRPRVVIRSLDPANPVLVNGMEVPSQTLENGDVVKVGDQTFTYVGPEQFDDPGSLTADDSAGGWKF